MNNLTERLSKVGHGFLWCVQVVGPDDVLAMPSYAVAVQFADDMNAVTIDHMEQCDIATIYMASIWPNSPDSHAADLAKRQAMPGVDHG